VFAESRPSRPLTYLQRVKKWHAVESSNALDAEELFDLGYCAHIIVAEALIIDPKPQLSERQRSLFLEAIENLGFDNKGHTDQNDLREYSFKQAEKYARFLSPERLKGGLSRDQVIEVETQVAQLRKIYGNQTSGYKLHYNPHKWFRHICKNSPRKLAYLYSIFPEVKNCTYPAHTDAQGYSVDLPEFAIPQNSNLLPTLPNSPDLNEFCLPKVQTCLTTHQENQFLQTLYP
jgi:hypothetical protein